MTTVTMTESTPVVSLEVGVQKGMLKLIEDHPKGAPNAPNWRFLFEVSGQLVSGLVTKRLSPGNRLDKWLQAFNVFLKPGQTFQMSELYNQSVYVELKAVTKNSNIYMNVVEVFAALPTKAVEQKIAVTPSRAPTVSVSASISSATPPIAVSSPAAKMDAPPVAAQPVPAVIPPASKPAISDPLANMDLKQAIDF